jgi:endopeptidase La
MFPAEFDSNILESLPLIKDEDITRITLLLRNIISIRILPFFRKNRGTDPIHVAQVDQNVSIRRLEDDQGRIRAVSLIERDGDNWTIYIHERVFDYFAFVIPAAQTEIHVDQGTPEQQEMLALAEFILRHQIEHILYPDESARRLIQADIDFVLHKKKSDPTFYKILRRAMADELNGIQLDAYLRMIDVSQEKGSINAFVRSILNSYAEMIADLPDDKLHKKFIQYDAELKTRILGVCFGRASDTAYSLLNRAVFVQKLFRLFTDLVENDAPEAELVFNNFRQVWGLVNLFRELEIPNASFDDKEPKEVFEYFKENLHLFKDKLKPDEKETCLPPPPIPKSKIAGPADVKSLAERIDEAKENPEFPADVLAVIEKNKTSMLGQSGSKYSEFVDTLLTIPWGKVKKIEVTADSFELGLENSHFGLERAKEIISDFFANLIWKYKNVDNKTAAWRGNGSAFLFVGPPGVGKTSLAVSIAENLGIPYHKISLGGMSDEAELRGHGFTYEGSKPGAIVQGLIRMGTMNGMFILDEADKAEKFAIATLLEILDPEQNHLFHDKYVQTTIDVDLSNCHFILTANMLENVPLPIINRCEVVALDRYTVDEKIQIARKYLIERIQQKYALTKETVSFEQKYEEDILRYLVKNYTHEAGVRQLERIIRTVFLRALRKEVLNKKRSSVQIKPQQVKLFLEQPRRLQHINDNDGIGEILGLGVNMELGLGSLIPIQVTSIKDGKRPRADYLNAIQATGNIQKIMDESRAVATTAILNCAEALGADVALMKSPIHFHFMGGSTPKDGPSAGGAIALALASLLLQKPVRREVAMTGEIDTQGRITMIGGLDMKLETAYDAGCKTVIVPAENLQQDDSLARLKKVIGKKAQVLTYSQWKEGQEQFDRARHSIQVIGIDHILEAVDIALINPEEIDSIQRTFSVNDDLKLKMAENPNSAGLSICLPFFKDTKHLKKDEGHQLAQFCLIHSDTKPFADTLTHSSSNPSVQFTYKKTDLAPIIKDILDKYSDEKNGSRMLVLSAAFWFLRKIKHSIEREIGQNRIIYVANNYSSQGIRVNNCKSLLTQVYLDICRISPRYLDTSPYIKKLNGVYVLDLSFIPEKYRLDSQRAESILKKCLSLWRDETRSLRLNAA